MASCVSHVMSQILMLYGGPLQAENLDFKMRDDYCGSQTYFKEGSYFASIQNTFDSSGDYFNNTTFNNQAVAISSML